jgi:hypothetical protein
MFSLVDANALIRFSFDGASPPMPGQYCYQYGFCHTSGGPYVAGQVYYDDGFVHRGIQIYEGLRIVTTNAVIGAVTLAADNIYVAESINPPFAWTSKGGGSGRKSFTLVYNSDGNLSVGNMVYQSYNTGHYVLKVTDNNSINPVIGIVLTLLSGNTVEVAHIGEFSIQDVLTRGRPVYVSTFGGFTTTPPQTNFVQIVGVATSATSLFFNPELRRIRR